MEESKRCPLCQGAGKHEMLNGKVALVRCETCGFVYANATDEEILEANSHNDEETMARYDRIQSGYDLAWFDWTAKKLASGKNKRRVLDIGCGNCLLLQSFAKLGWSCSGIDPSPWADECGRSHGFTIYREADVAVSQDSFDLVVVTSTLEHIAQPRKHVSFALRCLKKGGVGYWTVPNCFSIALRLGLANLPPQTIPGHCNFFSAKTLKQLFLAEDLQEQLEYVKVRSYGLPELYRHWKKFRLRRSPTEKTSPKTRPKSFSPKLLVQLYYWAGRPLCWGDKLEVLIRKAI